MTKLTRRQLFSGALGKLRGDHLKEGWDESGTKPDKEPPAKDSGHSSAKEADSLFGARRWGEAIEAYRALVRETPNHAGIRRKLGFCLYSQGQYIQAKVEFQRALRILKEDNPSVLYLGLCAARMDRKEQVRMAWSQFFDPQNVELQREINLQSALLEEEDGPSGPAAADAVETVLGRQPYGV